MYSRIHINIKCFIYFSLVYLLTLYQLHRLLALDGRMTLNGELEVLQAYFGAVTAPLV
jgi:hypothetical protein